MKTIVLAHGILGFGGTPLLNYFNDVERHLSAQGHAVHAPGVDAVGSVRARGSQLAGAIRHAAQHTKIHIIAHSLGGLDARHAIAHEGVADLVATLVTIGTPNQGSPVADAIANGGDLLQHVPAAIVRLLEHAPALHDLTTDVRTANPIPDRAVRYIDIAGDASRTDHELLLFRLSEAIGKMCNDINDGMVTRNSAVLPGHEHLEEDVWPVDHGGEIGWIFNPLHPLRALRTHAEHLARYDDIVSRLTA